MNRPNSLGQRFGFLGRSFKKKLDEMLKEEDLTGVQFCVLKSLLRLEETGADEISQKDLEQATHLAHPTMTDIVGRLERKGFLRCDVSGKDRRRKCIASTEKARLLSERARQVDEETAAWLCRGLTQEQQDMLVVVTDRMIRNVMQGSAEGGERA